MDKPIPVLLHLPGNSFRSSFNKFRMSGKELPGKCNRTSIPFPLILNLLKDERKGDGLSGAATIRGDTT